jgi:Ca2+-binding EF-hand superfamily protein
MMTRFKSTLLAGLLAGAALSGLPALAQEAGSPPAPWPRFDMKQMDTDGDGKVTLEEIQAKRKAEVTALDANNDGKISAEELVNAEMARIRPGVEARVAARIKALDVDGDGMLSAAELATPPGGARMFERMDRDGDGAISPEEMEAMHQKMMDMGPRGDRMGKGKGEGMGKGMMGQHGEGRDGHGPRGDHQGRHAPPPAEGAQDGDAAPDAN